jgi:hypothetical protein
MLVPGMHLHNNTLVPRFFAVYPEPLAEVTDALAQLDCGRSRCPHCSQHHRECAFAFPPRGLLVPFVAKARSDGLRGVIVRAVGLGVANARGRVPHVSRRSAGPVRHRF